MKIGVDAREIQDGVVTGIPRDTETCFKYLILDYVIRDSVIA